MIDPFNPASGAIQSQTGAGWPPSESIPGTFQLLNVGSSCAWSTSLLSVRSMWATGTVLCWPQVRDEFPSGAASRRFPAIICAGEIQNESLKDPNNSHLWTAELDILVSTGKATDMRSIFWPFRPRIHEQLLAQNLCFRFELAPTPKYVELKILFSHRVGSPADGFKNFNVRADMRQIDAATTPPGGGMVT